MITTTNNDAGASAAAADLVTVSEAARRLGVNKSTVSRQVRKFGVAMNDDRFSYAGYLALRETALNPLMARQGGMAAEVMDFDGGAAPPALDAGAAHPGSSARGGHLMNAATAEKALRAKLLQMDLEERQGLVLRRGEVERHLATAARTLRDGLLGLPSRLAGDLAPMTDPAEIKALLDRHVREHLDVMAAAFQTLAADERKAA